VKAFRHDAALRLLLQAVVADGRSSGQRGFEVARFEHILHGVGALAPDAGQAVGLQFHPHGEGIALGFADPLLGAVNLVGDAQQVLDVVADFVGDDVGLGEFAGRLEALLQLAEEDEVDVDLLVARAVETAPSPTDRCRRRWASRR
jgi:hypothetical protein